MATDYYRILSGAIRALERPSTEARNAVYHRARQMVQEHLRAGSLEQTRSESQALEDAIWRVELETTSDNVANGPRSQIASRTRMGATPQNDPLFRGSRVAITLGCSVVLLVAVAGFLFAQKRANDHADQQVRAVLFESDLGRFVRVKEVSAGLIDATVTLRNVEFRFPNIEPINAKQLVVSNFKKFGGTVVSVRANIADFQIPLESSRSERPLVLREFGSSIRGSLEFSYD